MAASLSFEEKIDYIYKELKAQKRGRLFKLFIKIAIIGLIVTLLNSVDKDKIMGAATKLIWDIAKPITQDLIKDIMQDNISPTNVQNSLLEEIKNNPDLLNKLKQ